MMATATKTVKFHPTRDYDIHIYLTSFLVFVAGLFTLIPVFLMLPVTPEGYFAPLVNGIPVVDIFAVLLTFALPMLPALAFQRIVSRKADAQEAAKKRNRYYR